RLGGDGGVSTVFAAGADRSRGAPRGRRWQQADSSLGMVVSGAGGGCVFCGENSGARDGVALPATLESFEQRAVGTHDGEVSTAGIKSLMTNVQREQGISKALKDLAEPEIGRTLGQLDMLKGVRVGDDGTVHVEIELPTPAYPQRERITQAVEQTLKNASLLN